MKKKTRKQIIKKLDTTFSKYIRLRDCLRTTQTPDQGLCITCGKLVYLKEAHAGHFISRGRMNIRFDETNVHLQCCGCNTYGNGEQAKYLIALEKLYGREIVDNLMQLERDWLGGIDKVSTGELRDLLDMYKDKLNNLI